MKAKKKEKPRAMVGKVPVWCVHDALVYVVELKPNPKNPNTHPASQIELLGKIIKEQGWRAPITVSKRSGLIVKGHGRLEAAFKAGISKAPVDFQDYESEAAEHADMVADNRLAELAVVDNSKLSELMKELNDFDIDLEMTGFTTDEFDKILRTNVEKKQEHDYSREEEDYKYQIVVECLSETHQAELLERFDKEDLKCRPLIL